MYETIVVNERPLLVTNASCCSNPNAMCQTCRATALAATSGVVNAACCPNPFQQCPRCRDLSVVVNVSDDPNDLLLTPTEAVRNAEDVELDDEHLPSAPEPVPTKVTCEQCSGTGSTVEINSPNAQFGLPNRQVACNLCEGKGFTLEGPAKFSAVAPNLASVMEQADNSAQLVYAGSPVTNLQDDFDENDTLLPNQF